jgi:hypothetical protein
MVDGEHTEVKGFYEGRGWEAMDVLAMAKEFGA